jgi:hypothetical protein
MGISGQPFYSPKLVSTNLLFLVLVLTLEPVFVLTEVFLLSIGQFVEFKPLVTVA